MNTNSSHDTKIFVMQIIKFFRFIIEILLFNKSLRKYVEKFHATNIKSEEILFPHYLVKMGIEEFNITSIDTL